MALEAVLKACGDDLSTENILKQAYAIKDLELPMLLPGIKVNTSADRPRAGRPDAVHALQRQDLGALWRVADRELMFVIPRFARSRVTPGCSPHSRNSFRNARIGVKHFLVPVGALRVMGGLLHLDDLAILGEDAVGEPGAAPARPDRERREFWGGAPTARQRCGCCVWAASIGV